MSAYQAFHAWLLSSGLSGTKVSFLMLTRMRGCVTRNDSECDQQFHVANKRSYWLYQSLITDHLYPVRLRPATPRFDSRSSRP
jgi:hypothetical protein